MSSVSNLCGQQHSFVMNPSHDWSPQPPLGTSQWRTEEGVGVAMVLVGRIQRRRGQGEAARGGCSGVGEDSEEDTMAGGCGKREERRQWCRGREGRRRRRDTKRRHKRRWRRKERSPWGGGGAGWGGEADRARGRIVKKMDEGGKSKNLDVSQRT